MNHNLLFLVDNSPEEANEEINKFKEKLEKEYLNQELTEKTLSELKIKIKEFEQILKEKYYNNNIICRLYGDIEYIPKYMNLKEVCELYKQEFPQKYIEKDQYTRLEVNKMLFDLQMNDIIREYRLNPYPYNEMFYGTILVEYKI